MEIYDKSMEIYGNRHFCHRLGASPSLDSPRFIWMAGARTSLPARLDAGTGNPWRLEYMINDI